MDIIEQTRKLCAALQNEEVYKNYAAAKLANDEDKQLQEDIGNFNLVRMQIDQCLSAENDENGIDKEAIKTRVAELNGELKDLYGKIMENQVMVNYNKAKGELDTLVSQINAVISLTLNGEDPLTCDITSGCSGSCESCGGCH